MTGRGEAEAVERADRAGLPALRAGPGAMAAALDRVAREDAAVLQLLQSEDCRLFIESGADLSFRSAKPVIGEGERAVYQDFDICLSIPEPHPLWQLTQAVERLIAASLAAMPRPPLEALPLNDLVLQRYPPRARGITPHRDHVRYVGLVVIVQLSGDGRFGLCADRSGRGARVLEAGPGDGILMRAPGFGGATQRPFHFLDGIAVERYSLGMRCDKTREAQAA
ncbi:MAG: hypothetical protein OXO52_21145 [Rhodospirillales bacterium]|nr:hypothetical protein [Rhodospirillales bacterium]MDE0381300.1 hypothetical protein [Rhodospirillales bacterium]